MPTMQPKGGLKIVSPTIARSTMIPHRKPTVAQLRELEVRTMIHLIGEVAALQGDHEGRKRALMDGLCKLIGAEFWVWGLASRFQPGQQSDYAALLSGGFSPGQFAKLVVAIDHPDLATLTLPIRQRGRYRRSPRHPTAPGHGPRRPVLHLRRLPPRQRTTLNLLLEGLPHKHIADRMELSVHTVNDYVKQIYAFFEVNSHAELLIRFQAGNGGHTP